MIKREIAPKIKEAFKKFPGIVVTGPRQSGKTTLVKNTFPKATYITLENIEERNFAIKDPKGFLQAYKPPVIIDEAQYAPDLFSYIQTKMDEIEKPGLYVLTGSQNLLLAQSISQSLAGRVAIFTLLPFSISELKNADKIQRTSEDAMFKGFYPRVIAQDIDPTIWLPSYTTNYLERDVRNLLNISNLAAFQTFLKLCAGRTAQEINTSSLSMNVGVSHTTIKSWLSVLEASYIIYFLRPYYKNINKRLTKTPKLYFYDIGLASSLLGIENSDQLHTHPLKGALFETLIMGDFVKQALNEGRNFSGYFLKDKSDIEVDLVIEKGLENKYIEIKAGKTYSSDFFKSFHYYSTELNISDKNSYVVYGGNKSMKRKEGSVLAWNELYV